MKKINLKNINNARIPDHVMMDVIPLLNELVDAVHALQRNGVQPREEAPVKQEDPGKTPLPAEMPFDDRLKEAGIEFVEDIPSNPAQIKGIGPKRGKEIKDWLEAQ